MKDNSWRYDPIPEIVDGRNVADFIDPDIMARLAELEVRTAEGMGEGGGGETSR